MTEQATRSNHEIWIEPNGALDVRPQRRAETPHMSAVRIIREQVEARLDAISTHDDRPTLVGSAVVDADGELRTLFLRRS